MATFTNTATLSYNGVITSSNTTVGEILEQLSVSKTAVRPIYSRDDDVTYVISLVNSGNTALTDITLNDDLGSYELNGLTFTPLTYRDGSVRYFTDGVLQTPPVVTVDANKITIGGITVPANGNTTVIYEATPNRFASPAQDGSITNTVSVTGAGIANEVSDSELISAESAPQLSILKAMSPTVVSENGQLTYTLTIQNSGNIAVTAADDVIVADKFDPILNSISVTFNGTAWTEGVNYTYDNATGQFTTIAGQITVPAASFVRDVATGEWTVTPGISTIVITGTI